MPGTFVHRDNDVLASAAFQTMVQCHRNPERAVGRCHAIGDLPGRLQRWFARFAGEIEEVAESDPRHVIRFIIFPRPGFAEGRNRCVHESGIAGAQLSIAKAQLLSSRWAVSFDDEVGFARQLQQNSSAIRLLDIEGDAPFIGIEVEKVEALLGMRRIIFEWRHSPRFVAARWLDFDYVCAHVSEEFRAVKTQRTGEIQYSIAGQRR